MRRRGRVVAGLLALSGCAAPLAEGVDVYDAAKAGDILECRIYSQGVAATEERQLAAFDRCMLDKGYGWPPAWYKPPAKEDGS